MLYWNCSLLCSFEFSHSFTFIIILEGGLSPTFLFTELPQRTALWRQQHSIANLFFHFCHFISLLLLLRSLELRLVSRNFLCEDKGSVLFSLNFIAFSFLLFKLNGPPLLKGIAPGQDFCTSFIRQVGHATKSTFVLTTFYDVDCTHIYNILSSFRKKVSLGRKSYFIWNDQRDLSNTCYSAPSPNKLFL